MLDTWSGNPRAFASEIRNEYARTFSDPATIHAICEEYRAATTLDLVHDEADRARGRRIECPVLALWSCESTFLESLDVLGMWRQWANDVRGRALDCGHFLAEEAPDETGAELLGFFGRRQE
jgi:haloacetate dehalogenase